MTDVTYQLYRDGRYIRTIDEDEIIAEFLVDVAALRAGCGSRGMYDYSGRHDSGTWYAFVPID